MLNPSVKKELTFVYIIFLVVSGLFVAYSLNLDPIKVVEKEPDKGGQEIKPADVTLTMETSSGSTTLGEIRMTNQDTVLDFMEKLREEEKITFEKTAYTYGTEIDHVNGIYPAKEQRWAIFYEGTDVTYEIGNMNLKDDADYELRLIRTSRTQ